MASRPDPVAPADDAVRALARKLLQSPHAALSYIDPESGTPGISRIALGLLPDGRSISLVSSLASHSPALRKCPDCAFMVGEPEAKGDPLAHPRLMVRAKASFVTPDDPHRPAFRDHWLAHHPKAKLYIDFADFAFVLLVPVNALLNGGFARAHRLSAQDLLG